MTRRREPQGKAHGLRLRCAIYTRKSSEEGLEQSFNSLDAQREACEAYIMSQAGEGWTSLPTRYDDGGYSGGTMERPGLKQLLADIALRKVDVVVVYKVDRLTRSLADFARIVDVLDQNGASFVSVTQAFNTTSSMGRLTLNVLLSFAQFEREVTGERIRDKIAASKKKGMWMGGTPPLGYRPHERSLVIDEAEAATVRHIFERYLELLSVHALKDELAEQGICPRPSALTGQSRSFSRGALYHLLSNRIYVGEIVHKDASYPGQHEAIIARGMFGEVQALLAANRQERRSRTVTIGRSPLTGLLFDAQGQPLCPVATRNARGRAYRYYVSAHLQQGGRRSANDDGLRLPAPALEALVLAKLRHVHPSSEDWETARHSLVQVIVDERRMIIRCRSLGRPAPKTIDEQDFLSLITTDEMEIHTPVRFARWAGRSEIVRGANQRLGATIDRSLVRALAHAHALVKLATVGQGRGVRGTSGSKSETSSYTRRLARLAFLAPDIQQAIVEGRQPLRVNLERLMRMDLPMNWKEQRQLLDFSAD